MLYDSIAGLNHGGVESQCDLETATNTTYSRARRRLTVIGLKKGKKTARVSGLGGCIFVRSMLRACPLGRVLSVEWCRKPSRLFEASGILINQEWYRCYVNLKFNLHYILLLDINSSL
jgi:hypothetical protein